MTNSTDQTGNSLDDVFESSVPKDVERRLYEQMAEFRKKLPERPITRWTWPTVPVPRKWQAAAMAAAAILFIASMVAVLLRPRFSFADVAEAVQRLPWIHVVVTEDDDDTHEVWYSKKEDVSATRSDDWIEYHDHKLQIYWSYDMGKNVVYRVPEYTPRRADRFAMIAETMRVLLQGGQPVEKPLERLEFLGRQGSELELLNQSFERVTEDGREWLDYRLTIRYSNLPDPVQWLFRVDPQTMLPQVCRVEGKWEGKLASMEQRFGYPERGPSSVYELGAPQTARLVDRVPSDDIARILETLKVGRQRMDDYRAIVVGRMDDPEYAWWINERPMIMYRKADKTRVDDGRWLDTHPTFEKPADDTNLEKWWRDRVDEFVYCPYYITRDATTYSIETRVATDADGKNRLEAAAVKNWETTVRPGDMIPPYWSRSPEYVCRPPLGIPRQEFEPFLDLIPADGPPGTILLRVVRTGRMPGEEKSGPDKNLPDAYRHWLDPEKDFAIVRSDMLSGDAGTETIAHSTVIEELKRSPRGIWYATRFRVKAVPPVEHDQVFEVYIDFDVELPDSLFEPPKVGQVLAE